jgi:hypothetical protein
MYPHQQLTFYANKVVYERDTQIGKHAMLPQIFTSRERVRAQLIQVFQLRLRELGIEAHDQDEWLTIIKDPEKLEAYMKDAGLHDVGAAPTSLSELISNVKSGALASQNHIDYNENDSAKIEEEIRKSLEFLELLHEGSFKKISVALQEQAAKLRENAERLHKKLKPIAQALRCDNEDHYARYNIPQWRIEADLLEQFAKLFLIEGSSLW